MWSVVATISSYLSKKRFRSVDNHKWKTELSNGLLDVSMNRCHKSKRHQINCRHNRLIRGAGGKRTRHFYTQRKKKYRFRYNSVYLSSIPVNILPSIGFYLCSTHC